MLVPVTNGEIRAAIGFNAVVIENRLNLDLMDILEAHVSEFYDEIRILSRAQYKANLLVEGLRANDPNFNIMELDGDLWLVHGETRIERIDRNTFTDPDDPWSREKSPVDGMFDLRFFLIERLKVEQKALDVRHDLIEAVFSLRA